MTYLPGDVALARSTGVTAWAIRLGTRSRYNHARLITDTHGSVLEAMGNGARYGHVLAGDVVIRPPMTDTQRAAIPAIAKTLAGTPYGWVDVAALGLAQLGILLPSVKRRIERPDRLFCSELCDVAWSLAGFHAFNDGRTFQDVSPGDLEELAFRSGWEVIAA